MYHSNNRRKRNYMFKRSKNGANEWSFGKIPGVRFHKDKYCALDAEMVGVGRGGLISVLARVSIVNSKNEIIFHTYVKAEQPVTDYRSFVSGIKPEQIESDSAMEFSKVRQTVSKILQGKILIGHALENDLKILNIHHPWCDIRDTSTFPPFMKMRKIGFSMEDERTILCPRKLKELAWEILGTNIQVMGKPHCPVEDAIASMNLYKAVRDEWERVIQINSAINSTEISTRNSATLRYFPDTLNLNSSPVSPLYEENLEFIRQRHNYSYHKRVPMGPSHSTIPPSISQQHQYIGHNNNYNTNNNYWSNENWNYSQAFPTRYNTHTQQMTSRPKKLSQQNHYNKLNIKKSKQQPYNNYPQQEQHNYNPHTIEKS
jgi:DNA polymerase III epsilon subunit-like protein